MFSTVGLVLQSTDAAPPGASGIHKQGFSRLAIDSDHSRYGC
jgi:hypothetical protein